MSKPARWNVMAGAVDPDWLWAWRGLRLAVIGWEGTGPPVDVANRRAGSLSGGITWESGEHGLTFRMATTDHVNYGPAAAVGCTGLQPDAASCFGFAKMTGAGSGYQYLLNRSPGNTGSQPFSPLVQPSATAPRMNDWNKEHAPLPVNPNGDGKYHAYGYSHIPGGAAGDGRFYFDGRRRTPVTATAGAWTDTTSVWRVGANPEPNHGWVGPIGCVYLWDRVLTDAEHAMLADDPFGPVRRGRR